MAGQTPNRFSQSQEQESKESQGRFPYRYVPRNRAPAVCRVSRRTDFPKQKRQAVAQGRHYLHFSRLREKTKIKGLCAYAFRHTWITNMLKASVDIATVAALSHNSVRTIMLNYEHVARDEKTALIR